MHSPDTGVLALTAIGTPANGRSSRCSIGVGLGERALGVELDERAELRVDRLDPAHAGLHHFARGHGPVANARGQLNCGQEGECVQRMPESAH